MRWRLNYTLGPLLFLKIEEPLLEIFSFKSIFFFLNFSFHILSFFVVLISFFFLIYQFTLYASNDEACFKYRLVWFWLSGYMDIIPWVFSLKIAWSRISYDKRISRGIPRRIRMIGMVRYRTVNDLIFLVQQINYNHSLIY